MTKVRVKPVLGDHPFGHGQVVMDEVVSPQRTFTVLS